ncbi:heavy metal-associated isoprenylated plant protein 36 [Citrus sinensis]|uniref:heavy metal-associated isoprenylated plant protein 36 n=1 Tax=Citrus sinensis TaxID=2711 RepID=UPI000D624372|nr:heavy metal-associated isoprenylated plant protein 36 [Citrus sinensis]
MDGLHSVKYDTAKEMLKVSGSIDPEILIQKFDKWGRKAELYSFDKDSLHIDNGKGKNCCSSKRKTHGVKIKDFDSSSDSSDDCDEENCDSHAPKKVGKNISWQHPCLMKSSPKEENPMNKQSAKKSKKFFGGWFGKKDKAAKASGNKNTEGIASVKSPAASKWHFPRPSMPAYGVPGPFGYPPPPYGDRRLYHGNQYPPMMFARPMRPYYGYGLMPPPPYGLYQPRPPPRMNPMIHYTSYSDNYYP